MKRIVTILFLLFLSTPVFATAGWYEGCNDDIIVVPISEAREFFRTRDPNDRRPVLYDDGGVVHAYYKKLVKAYHEKYPTYYDEKGWGHSYRPAHSWNREVIIPLYKFLAELDIPGQYEEQTPAQREKNKEEARKMRREQDLEHMFGPLKRLLNISN